MEKPTKTLAIERIDQWFPKINIFSFSIEDWSKDNLNAEGTRKPNKAKYKAESGSDWDLQSARWAAEVILG